jgi:hypothetical protein
MFTLLNIFVWNAVTGEKMYELEKNSKFINQVIFFKLEIYI